MEKIDIRKQYVRHFKEDVIKYNETKKFLSKFYKIASNSRNRIIDFEIRSDSPYLFTVFGSNGKFSAFDSNFFDMEFPSMGMNIEIKDELIKTIVVNQTPMGIEIKISYKNNSKCSLTIKSSDLWKDL